jgi:hypothetical protein
MKRIYFAVMSIACFFTACQTQPVKNQINENRNGENRIAFQMDLANGTMDVTADYSRSRVDGNDFFLNRDFTITRLLVDGKALNPADIVEQVALTMFDGYTVNLYHLPFFTNGVHLEYRGMLSGETGMAPYVTETISADFTFLRWETICYPLFASAEDLFTKLMDSFALTMSVEVPKDYVVQFSGSNTAEKETAKGIIYTVRGDMPLAHHAAAIAQYRKSEYETGVYYFLPGTDAEKIREMVDTVMRRADAFMQEHYGAREFPQKLRVAEIPEHLGSFAVPEEHMTFAIGSSFNSTFDMVGLVHEFIHTGWNAKVEDLGVRRCRFFDESFTVYFTYRVMADIVGETAAQRLLQSFTNTRGYDLVPIKDFGAKEYGDLGYTIGALCLYKLSRLTGEEAFDRATKEFLEKYRDVPVDFEKFCEEYQRLCPDVDLEGFFQKWIYSDSYKDEVYL